MQNGVISPAITPAYGSKKILKLSLQSPQSLYNLSNKLTIFLCFFKYVILYVYMNYILFSYIFQLNMYIYMDSLKNGKFRIHRFCILPLLCIPDLTKIQKIIIWWRAAPLYPTCFWIEESSGNRFALNSISAKNLNNFFIESYFYLNLKFFFLKIV